MGLYWGWNGVLRLHRSWYRMVSLHTGSDGLWGCTADGRHAGVGHTVRGQHEHCSGVIGAATAQTPLPPTSIPPNMAAAPLLSAPQRPPARGKRRTFGMLHFRDGRRAALAATANQRSARAAAARNSNVERALPGAGSRSAIFGSESPGLGFLGFGFFFAPASPTGAKPR